MSKIKIPFIIFSILLLFTLAGCLSLAEDITPPPGAEMPPPSQDTLQPQPTAMVGGNVFPASLPDPNRGALIYIDKCAPCHGTTGMGDGPDASILENPVPALGSTEISRKSTPAEWYMVVTQGNMSKFMPPFTSLSDQERWDVVSYLYTLSTSSETIAQGETLFLGECAECHGEDARQGVVDLTDQAFLGERSAEDLVAFIKNGHELMPAFDGFNDDELWALTAYLRSLTFAPVEGSLTTEISESGTEAQDSGTSSEIDSPSSDVTTASDGMGSVTVDIVNASEEDLPADLEVVLRGYDSMVEVYTQTLTIAGGLEVLFTDVPMPLDRMYFATIEYANAVYGSDVTVVETGSPNELAFEITYYPPSTDTSLLNVDRLHVFLSFIDEKTLEIFQLYIFSNPTNQVLVPGEEGNVAVNFTIPTDASNLYVEDSMSMAYKKTNDGFGIVNIYPSETAYQTIYSYQLPYEDRKLDLSIPVSMDANAVIVMAPANSLKVKSDLLEDAGSRDFEGVSYNMYTGVNLKSGNTLDLNLSGRPGTDTRLFATTDGSNNSLVIGLAGLGGALVVVGVFLWYRNRASEEEDLDEDLAHDLNGETSEDIMDAIITLDDQYRTGGLPEGAYRTRRAELKEKLMGIIEGE